MGMLMATNYDKKPMLKTVENVVKNMFHDPTDAFYTGRAMDIMFDGVTVDCTSDDKITAALCLSFEDSKSFVKVDEGHLKFSLFGGVSKRIIYVYYFRRLQCKLTFLGESPLQQLKRAKRYNNYRSNEWNLCPLIYIFFDEV